MAVYFMKKPNFKLIEYQKKQDIKNRNNSTHETQGQSYTYKSYPMGDCVDIHNSLYRNFVVEAVNAIKNKNSGRSRPYLDFNKTQTLTPMAMIYFKQVLEQNKKKTCKGRTSPHSVVSGMLGKLGIAKRLGFKSAKTNHNFVERWYSFSGETTDLGDGYDEIENVLKEKFGEESETFDVVNTAIGEAIINVVNHAYTKDDEYKKWYLFLSIASDKCNVIISDLGITIPNSIPTKITDGFLKRIFNIDSWFGLDDGTKIEIATQYQKTSTQLSYRGKGFQDMKAVCDQIDGAMMMVHSKGGYWAKKTGEDDERIKKQTYKTAIDGTIVSWVLPLNDSMIDV